MAEPHDEGEIPELGDLADDLPPVYEGFEPISPGIKSFLYKHNINRDLEVL